MLAVTVELVVAAVVVGSFAVFAGGSPAKHSEDPQLRWSSHALPALTLLIGDLTTLGGDAARGAPSPSVLARDTMDLRRDVAAAALIGPPPSTALRSSWTAALGQVRAVVSSGETTAAAAGGPVYAADLDSLRSAITGAGDAVLRLTGAMRATP